MNDTEKPLTFDTVLTVDVEELNMILARDYYTPIPVSIDSAGDMLDAGKLLARITNAYSYLCVLFARTDARVRILKKDKDKKEEYTDLIGKRNALEAYVDILKQSYAGLSREIATRQEALREINMSRNVT
ncbi:MAG: hypothetical protein ACI4CS_04520 [Candidatus Weimeria sp.]